MAIKLLLGIMSALNITLITLAWFSGAGLWFKVIATVLLSLFTVFYIIALIALCQWPNDEDIY